MKPKKILGWSSALALSVGALAAQETTTVEQLQRQLKQATETFNKAMEEQRKLIEELTRKLQALDQSKIASNSFAATVTTNAGQQARGPASRQDNDKPWSPADPLRLGRGSAYADLGFVGSFVVGGSSADDIEGELEPGGHDPNQRGFTVQGMEMNVTGAIDPYFRGQANLLFSVDAEGESFFELEEAWMETTGLPWNLQLRGGQMFSDFGRHNPTHVHSWSFVDTPLANARFLGPDGLRNPGARLAWLAPTPFYSELSFGIQDSHGETAASFRSEGGHHGEEDEQEAPFAYRHADNDRGIEHLNDLLFLPRVVVSFDLTPSQVLLFGGSAALGPNSRGGESAGDTSTQIYGVDLTWKWKSPRHQAGFPFVMWQSEAMLRKYDAGAFDWNDEGTAADPNILLEAGAPAVLPGETLTDYGFYTQLLYGFRKGWVVGTRFDFVTSNEAAYERLDLTFNGEPLGRDPMRAQRWRLSPNLTWYPTEFSKIRLQYNYDDRLGIGRDHSVWLQFEFLLGAHAAHKF